MRLLIFTEGGKKSGLGHISRCSSLYKVAEMMSIEVKIFINGKSNEVADFECGNFEFVNWLKEGYLKELIKATDYCIVDSYIAGTSIYDEVEENSCNSIFLDDNAKVDITKGVIVNPSLYPYNLYNNNSGDVLLLLGSEYIILRQAFLNARREFLESSVRVVLIIMGGTDIRNLTPLIVKRIARKYTDIRFNVVMGEGGIRADEFADIDNVRVYQYIDADEMNNLMLDSDMAITAAGQTIYELIITQTPFIPIKVVDNQDNNIEGLLQFKLINEVLAYDDSQLIERVEEAFESLLAKENREELYEKYSGVLDGKGSLRIIEALIGKTFVQDGLYIRNVKSADVEDVFNLSNAPYVRNNSLSKVEIDWPTHLEWFQSVIRSKDHVFYVVTNSEEEFMGQIRYKIDSGIATVSISFCMNLLGKGLSYVLLTRTISLLINKNKHIESLSALVSADNIASKKLFEKAGFNICGQKNNTLVYTYNIKRGDDDEVI